MRKILRPLLRKVLKRLSQAVLAKHKPEVIIAIGNGPTAIVREAIYIALHERCPARRNLESPEAEFSVPLTLFGAPEYPRSPAGWAKVLLKTFLQFLILKPYPHKLILELNTGNPEIANYWLEITQPKVIIICGEVPTAIRYPPSVARFFKVDNHKNNPKSGPLRPYLALARKVGNYYKMSAAEVEKALENFELPQPRIRLLAGRRGRLIVDSTYYYLPPPLQSVLEIVNPLPERKLFILDASLYESEIHKLDKRKDFKVASSLDRGLLKNCGVVVVRGPKRNWQSSLKKLAAARFPDV